MISPQSSSVLEIRPFGASTIRHASVRIRKLVKNGIASNASTMPLPRWTLIASRYARGNAITRHSAVPSTVVRMPCMSTLKNVPPNPPSSASR